MKLIQKLLDANEFMKERALKYYGKYIRLLADNGIMLSMIVIVAILILFYAENETVEKIGTIASVVIAAIVCRMQLYSYRNEKRENRKNEAFRCCRFITANLIKHNGGHQKDVQMDYTRDRWKEIRTFDGRRYTLEWKMSYVAKLNRCKFLMVVGHFRNSREMELTERFEYLEFDFNDGVNSISSGRYRYKDSDPPEIDRIPTDIDNFSDTEWNTMIELMSGILPDAFS